MSAAFIWVIIPGIAAALLFFIRHNSRMVSVLGAGIAFFLAWVAWEIPLGEAISFGPVGFKISETLSVLGRDFSFTNLERPLLTFIYFGTAIWLGVSHYAKPGELFVPFALAIVSLLIAALAVKPFLYAALLIEIAVLLSIPLLAPPYRPAGRGVFRFLAYQTFGMPFILFTGWMLAGVGASPSDLTLVVRASALLGLGFAFLLAVFPFHTWIPMLAREVHPYLAAFLFFTFPVFISLFALGFLDRFVWLREAESVYLMLRSVGVVMIVVGGVWAAFETHLGKMFGFAAVMGIGLSLTAIGLGSSEGVSIFFLFLIPNLVSFIVWATTLSLLYRITQENLSFDAVRGLGLRYPLLAVGLFAGIFSLVGMPLFAGFPVMILLWGELVEISSFYLPGALLGSFGLLVGAMRALFALMNPIEGRQMQRDARTTNFSGLQSDLLHPLELLIVGLASAILLLIGLFPQWFVPILINLPLMFEQLGS